jgi:hypothetical protein
LRNTRASTKNETLAKKIKGEKEQFLAEAQRRKERKEYLILILQTGFHVDISRYYLIPLSKEELQAIKGKNPEGKG